MEFSRYVAIGDSFTEGVGDPDPTRPNGLRGWADRVAEVLAGRTDDFGYANLAIRGRKLHGILDEQLEPALALRPDLVTSYAGANDIMRPRVDLDDLAASYDAAVGRLTASGATVVLFTAFDPGGSAVYRPLRGRLALYTEAVREIAERHGTRLVDFWRLREYREWGYWDTDRMHMDLPATSTWPSRSSTPSASRTRWRSCPRRRTPSSPVASCAPTTSSGRAPMRSRGCTGASPAGPPATPSRPGDRSSAPSEAEPPGSALGVVALHDPGSHHTDRDVQPSDEGDHQQQGDHQEQD